MKNQLLIFSLLIILKASCFAQNLVPNPSFEDTVSCPIGLNEVNKASGWSSFGNTPDYWNACSQVMNIPQTQGGFQNAFDGNAFCGVYTYDAGFTGAPNYREYIGVQLNYPLIIGQKYFVSFKLNKPNDLECATNNFGAYFSTASYSETNPISFNNIPQIITTQIITDTLNWTTISESFIPDSAYKYIILGSFYSDSNTATILYNGYTDCIAYYFIDMVCVSTDSLTCNPLVSTNKIYSSTNNVKIFPNPAKEKIFIDLPVNINKLDVCIVNILGCIVKEKIIRKADNEISLVNIPKGSYLISTKNSHIILNRVLIIN